MLNFSRFRLKKIQSIIKKVKNIIQADERRVFCVPSAPGRRFDGDDKVTDLLYALYRCVKKNEDETEKIGEEFGDDVAKYLHCHFSKIEWTDSGEKKHLTFEDTVFGPDFEPLMDLVLEYKLTPRFICESDGTQSEDALAMKQYYLKRSAIML